MSKTMNILQAKSHHYDYFKWPSQSQSQSQSPPRLQTQPTVRCRNFHLHPPPLSPLPHHHSILFALLVCFMSHSQCHAFMISEAQPFRCGPPRMFYRPAHHKRSPFPRLNFQKVNGGHHSNGQERDRNNNNNNNDGLSRMGNTKHPTSYHDIPKHVAFVCDGNSRWAKARNLPTVFGHAEGARRLVEIIESLKQYGVSYCTMYGFSTENWRRSPSEINDILTVMEQTARRFHSQALHDRVRVKILGDIHDERIPTSLRDILQQLERDTSVFGQEEETTTSLTICLAVNYGGRQDIVNASVRMAQAMANGELSPTDVTEDTFASYMYTHDIPDPDLIIRTSGECRMSNFLLWNAAYSELYFTPVLWPDFGEDHWKEAVDWYRDRKRRFGGRADSYSPSSTSTTSTSGKSTAPQRISVAEP